jgi:hypothetical protein
MATRPISPQTRGEMGALLPQIRNPTNPTRFNTGECEDGTGASECTLTRPGPSGGDLQGRHPHGRPFSFATFKLTGWTAPAAASSCREEDVGLVETVGGSSEYRSISGKLLQWDPPPQPPQRRSYPNRRLPRSRTPLLGTARNQSALRRSRLGVRLLSSRLRSLLQPTRRNKPTPPEEHLAKNEGILALAWPT